jgi:hypothetical protein
MKESGSGLVVSEIDWSPRNMREEKTHGKNAALSLAIGTGRTS